MAIRRIRYSEKNNSDIILRIVCAIVFCLSSFLYLFVFQVDVMALRLNDALGGTSCYNPFVFSFVATAVLYGLHFVPWLFFRHYRPFHAVTYLSSLAVLWCMAEADTEDAGSLFVLLFIVLILLVSVLLLKSHAVFVWQIHNMNTLARKMWVNVLMLSLMFITICSLSRYDNVMRYRLRMERMIAVGEYGDALLVGRRMPDTDAGLTMLRIYALSRQGLLGDMLFRYPVKGGSRALLPYGTGDRCLLLTDADIYDYLGLKKHCSYKPLDKLNALSASSYTKAPVRDYILCGLLLDKNIDAFVRMLMKCGITELGSLPRHYREALILYSHTRSSHIMKYSNAAMDADYMDMQALENKYAASSAARRASVKETYGNTYWYYYFYE